MYSPLFTPSALSGELWNRSGRFDSVGPEMARFTDHRGRPSLPQERLQARHELRLVLEQKGVAGTRVQHQLGPVDHPG